MEEFENHNYIEPTRGCCINNSCDKPLSDLNQQRYCKLASNNWLTDYPTNKAVNEIFVAEVRFKNGRKEFFSYNSEMELKEGEIVAVEAAPGHDIGIVSMVGELVRLQLTRKREDAKKREMKQVFRHARPADIEKWMEVIKLEDTTMLQSRRITSSLKLDMKINDVEYQGDKTKAIFYYTASDRVDFRELIRHLAEAFRVRIEMRQIGVRQEAAKLGGIGPCGRELCCASFMSSFKSVSTNSARVQQLSLNPQKLAGQCGKLKCCLNYEVDNYVDSLKSFPDQSTPLNTKKGKAYHMKSDVFKKIMWYCYVGDSNNMMAINIEKVKEIMKMNRNGKLPVDLETYAEKSEAKEPADIDRVNDISSYI
jgi:cell fate regulator YaaT (PSP1 superfamily)